jgi:hypothetical protein
MAASPIVDTPAGSRGNRHVKFTSHCTPGKVRVEGWREVAPAMGFRTVSVRSDTTHIDDA